MFECVICRFSGFELDDVALKLKSGRIVCLHCFRREVADEKPVPVAVRRDAGSAADSA